MAEEQYSVTSKQELSGYQQLSGYSNKLLDKLCMQWNNVLFCDMFIVTSNKHLPVHACVMSAFSSRVSAHISKSSSTIFGRKLSPPYIMKVEFSYEVIDAIVRALYTGVFCPPTSVLPEVYAAVEWLDIFELSELLKKYYGSPRGQAPEGEDMNCEVNTDTNIQAVKPPDNVDDYENSIVKVPECIITRDTSVKENSPVSNDPLLKSKSHSFELVRRTARKSISIPRRYNQDQFVLDQCKKVWSSDKFSRNASLSTPRAAKQKRERHPGNEADLHTSQKDLLLPGAPLKNLKEKLSTVPVNQPGQTLLPDSSEAEKADSDKTSPQAMDSIKTPQGVSLPEKHPVLSSKPQKKKSDIPQGKEIVTTVIAEDKLSTVPVNQPGQTLLPDSSEAEKADCDKTSPQAMDSIKTPQGIGLPEKHPVLSSKLKQKKSDTPQGKEIVTTVIAEVSDTDPIKSEIDLLIADIEIIKCQKCYIKFSSMDMYVAHINDHPVFKCNDCGEVFYRKSNYTKHQRDKHLGRPYLKCRLCGYQAQTEVECRSHSDVVHGERKPFICPKEGCGFRSRKYRGLNAHMTIHSNEKEYCCEKCGQRFSHIWSLQSHHNACYRLGSFLCDLCGQSFNHQQSMKIHRRTMHMLEKPYHCKVCSKQFSHHGNLKRHMRIHNNSFPYACPICKESFRHSNTLKGHMSARHKEAGSLQSVLNSDSSNRLGGFSYKRELKNQSVSKVVGMKTGVKGKKLKKDRKRSRFAASPPQMFQTSSLSEGDALPSLEEAHFIIDGIDLDEDVMSNSNPLDSLDTKQLDRLSGDNGTWI